MAFGRKGLGVVNLIDLDLSVREGDVDVTSSDLFSVLNAGAGQSILKSVLGKKSQATMPDTTSALFQPSKKSAAAKTFGSVPTQGKSSDVSPAQGDAVMVSKLGAALTGRAADFFNVMDDKAKAKLEGLVNSGQVSAEDAVKGLQYWADTTSFDKAMAQVPLSNDEQALATQRDDRQAVAQAAYGAVFSAVGNAGAIQQQIQKLTDSGQAVPDDLMAQYQASVAQASALGATAAAAQEQAANARSVNVTIFQDHFNVVAAAKAASGHPDGAVMYSSDDGAAADRLAAAGFTRLDLKGTYDAYPAIPL
ncbi:hypothetical protein [Nitrospirillum pindoramense]|uniref:Uncharacterized protein n=1 Tax=Nitrospirillum amazonense TaxID=28077 RepID=A0A560H8I5_9PROT|nr:hypothetical protein [Nitrospirillum amazonense]TWB41964.1 hypothetical protein FBZ90_107343 [Nitrospirillum amazonense]